jgi:DNA-binding CsgD family transcriptional regulator
VHALKNEYDELHHLIAEECNVPDNLFPANGEDDKYCYFLFRYATCNFIYFDSGYEAFTGYLPKEHERGGLDFWFSKVHPDDRRMLGDRIIESLKISKQSFSTAHRDPQTLNYRFKKGTGEWLWIQHTVYNLSLDSAGHLDKVLHKLQLLDLSKHPTDMNEVTYKLSFNNTPPVSTLTERERQVLKLIAEGFSTKMIASQLKISINTVETHRRHLLEKLDAKNSMELIKKGFRLFWN